MPLFSVLAAAAQIRLGIEAALLHPPGEFGIPRRSHIHEEAAIGKHQRRRVAIALHAFLCRDEHRDAGAILRFVENLLHFVLIRGEGDGRLGKNFCLSGAEVVAINGRRDDERLKAVEAFAGIFAAVQFGGRAERRV